MHYFRLYIFFLTKITQASRILRTRKSCAGIHIQLIPLVQPLPVITPFFIIEAFIIIPPSEIVTDNAPPQNSRNSTIIAIKTMINGLFLYVSISFTHFQYWDVFVLPATIRVHLLSIQKQKLQYSIKIIS